MGPTRREAGERARESGDIVEVREERQEDMFA